MVKKKELNLDELLKPDKDFEKSKRLDLDKKVTLYYSKKLPQRKIDELFSELLDSVKFAYENDIEFLTNKDENISKYVLYLTVKYFTNLEETLKGYDLYVNIDTFNQLYDKGYLSKILATLDEEETTKIQTIYGELTKHIAKIQSDKKVRQQMALALAKEPALKNLIKNGKIEI